jgi:hypothetical protein
MKLELDVQEATTVVDLLDGLVRKEGLAAAPFAITLQRRIEAGLRDEQREATIAAHKAAEKAAEDKAERYRTAPDEKPTSD